MKDFGEVWGSFALTLGSRQGVGEKLAAVRRAAESLDQRVTGVVKRLQESDARIAAAQIAGSIAVVTVAIATAIRLFG